MIKGFKEFLMRGNMMDLAVVVVISAPFGAVCGYHGPDGGLFPNLLNL